MSLPNYALVTNGILCHYQYQMSGEACLQMTLNLLNNKPLQHGMQSLLLKMLQLMAGVIQMPLQNLNRTKMLQTHGRLVNRNNNPMKYVNQSAASATVSSVLHMLDANG